MVIMYELRTYQNLYLKNVYVFYFLFTNHYFFELDGTEFICLHIFILHDQYLWHNVAFSKDSVECVSRTTRQITLA